MKDIDLNIGSDSCSKYGVSDFYGESESILAEALAGEEDFTACGSSRKDPVSCSITRRNDEIVCMVYQYMDEDVALIEDALFHLGFKEEPLGDVIIEKMFEFMQTNPEFSDEANAYRKLPVTATIDEIKTALSSAHEETDGILDRNFKFVCDALYEMLRSEKDVFMC